MINSIIEGISRAINAEFGDDHAIYAEKVEQGLKEPCFFISCIAPTKRLFVGRRYFRTNTFCIQFFPRDPDYEKEECNAAAERLFSCLEYITIDGDLMRGTGMKSETVDGVLNFFVNYDCFEIRQDSSDNNMSDIAKQISVKG